MNQIKTTKPNPINSHGKQQISSKNTKNGTIHKPKQTTHQRTQPLQTKHGLKQTIRRITRTIPWELPSEKKEIGLQGEKKKEGEGDKSRQPRLVYVIIINK